MTRVLFFAPTVGRGGVHQVVETLAASLAQYAGPDWQFEVLGQRFDEVGLPVHFPDSWPFTQVEPLADGEKMPAHPYQFPFLLKHAEDFVAHLNRVANDYDLVFIPSPWWTMKAHNWALTVPFVTTINDFAYDFIDIGILSEHFREVTKLLAVRAAQVTFSADFHRLHGETHYNFRRTKTISYSYDFATPNYNPSPEEARRVREKYHLPDQYALAFHCYGHKDPFTILSGHHLACAQSDAVPPLVMAGLETEHYLETDPQDVHVREFHQFRERHGFAIGENLFILGTLPNEDVAGLHAGATCAIQASHSEGQVSGGSFNAIMAHTPLIHTQLEVYREALGNDDHYALSFPVNDDTALAVAIVDICTNRFAAKKRADAAFDKVQQRTARDVVAEHLEVFSKAIEEYYHE